MFISCSECRGLTWGLRLTAETMEAAKQAAGAAARAALHAKASSPVPRFLAFNDARIAVHAHSLKSARDWRAWCRSGRRPPNIPSHPWVFYAGRGWKGFPDWLGYRRKRRTSGNEISQAGMSQILARAAAKQMFLDRAGTMYDFAGLPFRSSAQLLYRPEGSDRWCPLVLRSMNKLQGNDHALFFEAPKISSGAGIFCLVRESGRLFFLPNAELHQRRRRSAAFCTPKYRIPAREIENFEVKDNAHLFEILEQHRQSSTLLEEESLGQLFGMEIDVTSHRLSLRAFEFLRSKCGMTVRRPDPTADIFSSHFFMDDTPVLLRYCHVHNHIKGRCGRKVHIGLHHVLPGTTRQGEDLSWQRPKFVMVLFGHDRSGDGKEGSALDGMLLMPQKYMLSAGILPERAGTSCNAWLYAYPPTRPSRRADGRQMQEEQREFYVDLSDNADINTAAARVRLLFDLHANFDPDGQTQATCA